MYTASLRRRDRSGSPARQGTAGPWSESHLPGMATRWQSALNAFVIERRILSQQQPL